MRLEVFSIKILLSHQIMYCSVSCRDSDWKSSHEHSCFNTQNGYLMSHETVLDLNKTHLSAFGGIASFNSAANCVLQRLIQAISVQNIMSAAIKNEPMLSWSANDPRTRGFRDGKFATVDLEALISLEDNFDRLDATELSCFCKAG